MSNPVVGGVLQGRVNIPPPDDEGGHEYIVFAVEGPSRSPGDVIAWAFKVNGVEAALELDKELSATGLTVHVRAPYTVEPKPARDPAAEVEKILAMLGGTANAVAASLEFADVAGPTGHGPDYAASCPVAQVLRKEGVPEVKSVTPYSGVELEDGRTVKLPEPVREFVNLFDVSWRMIRRGAA